MPTKQRIDTTTTDPHAPTSAPTEDQTLRPWDYEPSAGPQGLYRQFALHFIDQEGYLKGLDDNAYAQALDAVEAAIALVLRCASVDPTWTAYYQRVTTPIKGGHSA